MMYPQETDEEMERRLLAEINARSSGGSAEDVDFAGLIGSMADPSLSAPSDGPAEVAPPQHSAPAMDTGRLATFQETFGEAEPAEMPELPAARQPAVQARYGGMMPAFDDAQMPDRSSQFDRQLADLDRQAQRERRRRGIFGALLSPLLHDRTDEFVGQNQDQYAARRADIVQRRNRMQEEQSRRQRERRQALLQQMDAQRRQASEDRRYELDRERLDIQRQGVESLAGHRSAQQEIGRGRLDLQRHTQDWREEQAQIERDAKEVRARIIAGQRVVTGGTAQRPGSGSGEGGPNVDNYLDAPVIRGFLSTRPEYMETARQLAQEARSSGQEANPEEIAWELASRGFQRLPRDEQDRIRRNFMSPETANSAINRPQREEHQLATRVRQYGGAVRDRSEWDRAVRATTQAIRGASDQDVRIAQQWLQGGMRQALGELSPGARQLAQRLARLQNILLRERSGAAVTDQEFARLRSELGANWFQSPDTMRAALADMAASSQEMERLLAAEYGPEVVQAYRANLQAAQPGGASASGDAGQWRAIGRSETGDIIYENTATGERRRRRAR